MTVRRMSGKQSSEELQKQDLNEQADAETTLAGERLFSLPSYQIRKLVLPVSPPLSPAV